MPGYLVAMRELRQLLRFPEGIEDHKYCWFHQGSISYALLAKCYGKSSISIADPKIANS